MDSRVFSTGLIRFSSLMIALFSLCPLAGQQAGNTPVIKLISPVPADSLNNSGVVTVTAEIVTDIPLQAFRIIHNSATVVDQAGMKPKMKDDRTYVISTFVPLRKGVNTIGLEARNSSGISFSETRTIISHIEPFITWLLPDQNNSNFESGVVNIKVEIRTLHPLQNLSININSVESSREAAGVIPAGENIYHFEKRIQLKPGRNAVYLTADNGKGITKSVSRIIYFGIPPVITLQSPLAADSINNSGLVTIVAEIVSSVPLQTYRIYHNNIAVLDEKRMAPEKKDSSTYILSSNLPLKKGFNTLYVEAKNALGTAISEKRTINSQSEPFVVWLTPGTGNVVAKSGTMNLRAEIKTIFPLQNLRVSLNGSLSGDETATLSRLKDDTYLFEKLIQLKPGKNTVFISAVNSRGSVKSATRIVNFGSAPQITLFSPSPRDSLNNSGMSLVRAEIVSYTPLQAFRIVNNEETAASESTLKPEQKDSATYTIGSNIPLRKGVNTIYVEVKNALGTSISKKQIVISQNEPFITWLSPAAPVSEAESGTVIIKAEIRSSLDLQSVRLNLNGTLQPPLEGEITKTNEGFYIFERRLQDVLSSKNSIILTASNIRGTTTSESRIVNYYSGSKPVITIASTDSLNNSGIFLFSAEIVSNTRLQTIRVVQNGTILAHESSSIPEPKDSITYELKSLIPLKAGPNIFYVEAKNAFGTGISEKRMIICKPEPIITWVLPSYANSTDETGLVKIKAEIVTSFDLINTSVNINGVALADQKDGITRVGNDKYILEKDIPLKEGDNTIVLSAGNARGIGYSQKRTINHVPAVIAEIKPEASLKEKTEAADNKEVAVVPETKTKTTGVQSEAPVITPEPPVAIPDVPAAKPEAPAVTWHSPSRQYTDINLNSARIKVSLRSSEKPQSLLVYVNGVASEDVTMLSVSDLPGEYTIDKTIGLRPGENSIYIIATNSGGTTRSETRYLTNPPANPPVVSWAVPADPNTIVNSEVVLIEACIKSATDLKEVKVLVNGIQQASDMMFPAPLTGECNYRIAKSVVLKDGDNSIYIIADNLAGSITSDRRVIRFKTGTVEKRLALVIGNSNYRNSTTLKNPVNDANLIEGTLKNLGFEVIKRLDATKDAMLEAVRDFSKKLTEYNVALFYYAGHGVQVDGQNYLLPVNAELNEQADCKWEAVPVNFIVEEFEKVPENINIVILDACRNNPFKSWARGGSEGFRALNAVTGTIVGYATSENSTAADGSGSNGTYTEELVKQMVIPQSISSVFINTRKNVLQRTNNSQRPQEWNMLTGDFFFKR